MISTRDQLPVVVVFDVGETLVNETRAWSEAAEAVGVSTLTLFGALGALIERHADHRDAWKLLGVSRPASSGHISRDDLYPDTARCLEALVGVGMRIGLAGNQPDGAEAALARLELPVSFIASSAGWGMEKPSPKFFNRIIEVAQVPAARIAYVGDRLDNDVLPARDAGMFSVFLRRGPWGHVHAHWPQASLADERIDSLDELPSILTNWRTQRGSAPSCTSAFIAERIRAHERFGDERCARVAMRWQR